MLAWVAARCDGRLGDALVDTPVGRVPTPAALDTSGLELEDGVLERLLRVDEDELRAQLPQVREHLARFGERLPDALQVQLRRLEARLSGS